MSEIFEIAVRGVNTPTNQTVLNVFHYWVDDQFVPTLEDCVEGAEQFHSTVTQRMVDVLSNDWELVDVTVTAQSNLIQYIYQPNTYTQGTRVGTAAPAQLAWSVKLQRTFTLTRSGGKRFSPIARDDVTPTGQLASAPIQTFMALLEGALAFSFVTPAGGYLWQPIIWGRVKDKLPASIVNPIAYARFTEATTQKTRQRGIGT